MSPATTTTTTGPGGRKSVLVTGGGSGIGLAMARHFASEGHLVAVLDVNAASGAKVVADLAAEFPAATIAFKKCDVTSWTDQAKVFAEVYEEHGARLDVVMANAGISEQGGSSSVDLTEETPSEPRLGAINVNLVGVVYSVKLAAHYMNKGKATSGASSRGSIICTSSNAGLYGFPIAPLYAASKAGVIGLVRSLAKPLAKANIQINALAPAVIETNIAPSKDLFKGMKITPMATLVRGVAQFVAEPARTGEIAEIHGESVTIRPQLEFVDKDSAENLERFWNLGYA